MKRPHFALPEIYGEPLSFYEILTKQCQLLNEETLDRKNADAELQNNINTEASAREQADTALRNDLTTETNAREQADTTLQQNINTEVSAREQADNELRELIRTSGGVTEAQLQEEVTARQQADTNLQQNINTEVSAREQADNELRELIRESGGGVIGVTEAQLQEEVTARQQADTALQTNIDNEKQSREQADTSLQTNIDNVNARFGNLKFVYQQNVPVHFTSSRTSDVLTPPENAVAILSVTGEPPGTAWTYTFFANEFKIKCVDNVQFDRSFNMNIVWACSQ